jgi:hypothetical protein
VSKGGDFSLSVLHDIHCSGGGACENFSCFGDDRAARAALEQLCAQGMLQRCDAFRDSRLTDIDRDRGAIERAVFGHCKKRSQLSEVNVHRQNPIP